MTPGPLEVQFRQTASGEELKQCILKSRRINQGAAWLEGLSCRMLVVGWFSRSSGFSPERKVSTHIHRGLRRQQDTTQVRPQGQFV